MPVSFRGFYLVEVLLAMLLAADGVMGLMKITLYIGARTDEMRHRIEALYLAEQKLEWLVSRKETLVAGIESGQAEKYPGTVTEYRVSWIVEDAGFGSRLKKVVVTVRWVSRFGIHDNVQLDTRLAVAPDS